MLVRADLSNRQLLLITGMHRSGTSFIASLCNVFGVQLPENLVPPNRWNKKGYFEATIVQDALERLLAELDRGWFDLRPFPDGWIDQVPARVCLSTLRQFLDQAYLTTSNLIVKDPRSSLLIPLWARLADEIGLDLRIMVVIRRPLHVARSLDVRDHMNPLIALALWWHHTICALQGCRGRPNAIAIYEDILRQPRILFDLLTNEIGMGSYSWSDDIEHRALACIDEDLQAFTPAAPAPITPPFAAECGDLYERLTKVKSVSKDFTVDTPNDLASILSWFPEWQRLFVRHLGAIATIERLSRAGQIEEVASVNNTARASVAAWSPHDRVSHV